MTIPKLTPYTGQVANPDGSQTQTEFTQNMFDQLSYEAQLATELDATIDGMNQAVTDVENNANAASASATAAEAAASTAGYKGLWPDTGGSAEKGDTYQTQVGGTPTGEYYTALQNTSVDPAGDNVNWKVNIGARNISNPNLISNSSFEVAGSVAIPPDATPRSYSAGDELFSGFFAAEDLVGVTYIDGKINGEKASGGTGQLYVDIYKTEKQKLSTAPHVASVASSDGVPIESGASFVDSGDYWRVTFDMDDTFSVKFEQGGVATRHEVNLSLFKAPTAVYRIPSDFETLQDAVDFLHSYTFNRNGSFTELRIEAGHKVVSGLKCSNGDYSNFRITSDDAVVYLSPDFSGVTINADEIANTVGANDQILFLAVNATFPEVRCLIDMQKRAGLGDGLNLSNSKGFVYDGCGVINASNRGLVVWSDSQISARKSIWDGANDEGVRVQGACSADLRLASINDCMASPSFGEAAVYVSRASIVEMRDASATGSGSDGVKVRRSVISGTGLNCSGASGTCLLAESNANVEASGVIANNGTVGIYSAGSRIVADGGDAKGNSPGLDMYVRAGGLIVGNVDTTNAVSGVTNIDDVNNLSAFNTWFSAGAVLNAQVGDSVVKGSSGDHTWYKYADGRMTYHVKGEIIATGTTASGAFTGQLNKPVLNETFVEIHSAHYDAVGRAGAGGTGGRVGVYLIGRPEIPVDPFKAFNTGEQPDGTGTGIAIESVRLDWTLFGTWI